MSDGAHHENPHSEIPQGENRAETKRAPAGMLEREIQEAGIRAMLDTIANHSEGEMIETGMRRDEAHPDRPAMPYTDILFGLRKGASLGSPDDVRALEIKFGGRVSTHIFGDGSTLAIETPYSAKKLQQIMDNGKGINPRFLQNVREAASQPADANSRRIDDLTIRQVRENITSSVKAAGEVGGIKYD